MKKIYLIVALMVLTFAGSVNAQNPTTYFMEGSTFRSQWNPAFAPQHGYVNIPILGGIELSTNGNVAVDNLLFSQNGKLSTIFSSAVPSTLALSELNNINHFGASNTLNIIGFGAYKSDHKTFWSVAVNLRTNIDTQLPYSFFDFMKTGKAQDISGMGFKADSYIEAVYTHSFPITDKIYLGVSGKLLIGAGRGRFYFDKFDAQMNADRWSANAVGVMELSGFDMETRRADDGTMCYDGLDSYSGKPAGYGFGVDVGVTYDVLPELQLSASINDIGCMFWSKKHTSRGVINKEIEFTGVQIDANGVATQPEFDLDEMEFEVADSKGVSEFLPTTINLGGEYNFLDRRIGLGVFYSIAFWEYKTRHDITASANFRPLKWLHASGSYSFIGNRAHALGLALNICPARGINFFLGTDFLLSKKTPQWIPVSQSNMNITFGMGVPIGRNSMRHE